MSMQRRTIPACVIVFRVAPFSPSPAAAALAGLNRECWHFLKGWMLLRFPSPRPSPRILHEYSFSLFTPPLRVLRSRHIPDDSPTPTATSFHVTVYPLSKSHPFLLFCLSLQSRAGFPDNSENMYWLLRDPRSSRLVYTVPPLDITPESWIVLRMEVLGDNNVCSSRYISVRWFFHRFSSPSPSVIRQLRSGNKKSPRQSRRKTRA